MVLDNEPVVRLRLPHLVSYFNFINYSPESYFDCPSLNLSTKTLT